MGTAKASGRLIVQALNFSCEIVPIERPEPRFELMLAMSLPLGFAFSTVGNVNVFAANQAVPV